MKNKFNVSGMHCSSCSSNLENTISKLKGVKKVSVNLLSKSMEVDYNENILNTDTIIDTVKSIGFEATVLDEKEEKNISEDIQKELTILRNKLFFSVIFLIPLMYVAMHHMIYEWFKIPVPNFIKNIIHGNENTINFVVIQLLLLIPILYINRGYFINGFKMLFKKIPNMDSLIAIGASAATIYGLFATIMIIVGSVNNNFSLVTHYSMDVYYESAGTILTLITLGKYLETRSKLKTTNAISSLMDLRPLQATVLRNNIELDVQYSQILTGDIVVVKPGGIIPVDGTIVYGETTVNESSITGESIPVYKNINDNVISGTINELGYIHFKATRVGKDTTLSNIINLVEEASNSKAPIAKLADKISGIFVPIVIIISIITGVIWYISGFGIEFSLARAISVLVISCPCALGLATPVAIMVGTGVSAKNGILIKEAKSLELLHSANTIVLDKTGTITEGKLNVTDIYSFEGIDETEILKILYSLEKGSEHLVAKAILKEAEKLELTNYPINNFSVITGMGVSGYINNQIYYAGNLRLLEKNSVDISYIEKYKDALSNISKTPIFLSDSSKILGFVLLQDSLRQTSKLAIDKFRKLGLNVHILTGDNKTSTYEMTKGLNVTSIITDVLPDEKAKNIELLKENNKTVIMVGDGINDSPALATADISISIGSGTDIATKTADIVIIKNDLLDVVTAILLSKKVMNTIKTNLFWAFFYNVIGIPVAAGLLYVPFGITLNPMFAAAAMSLSSVFVVLNALRLKFFKNNNYIN